MEEYSAVILHWDGKLHRSMLNRKVDRLVVLLMFSGVEQLLGVPEIRSSESDEQDLPFHHAVTKRRIIEKIKLCTLTQLTAVPEYSKEQVST